MESKDASKYLLFGIILIIILPSQASFHLLHVKKHQAFENEITQVREDWIMTLFLTITKEMCPMINLKEKLTAMYAPSHVKTIISNCQKMPENNPIFWLKAWNSA